MMRMLVNGTNGRTRSTACCRKERSPKRRINCLGVFSRLTGQNRSPRPPAMMTTKRSVEPPRTTGAEDAAFRDTGRDVAAEAFLTFLMLLIAEAAALGDFA